MTMATPKNKLQPDYVVTLNGVDLTSKIEPRLESLSISECRAEEADTLRIVLNDSDGKLDIPARGAVLSVSIGWSDASLVHKGSFTVDEVEHAGAPDKLTISARSASMTKSMGERQEKSWHAQTLGAIVKTIAARHNLQPVISAKLAAIQIAHIDQTHESDMSFLTRLAKRYDAVMTVKDGRLLFLPIGEGVTASGKLLQVLFIDRKSGDRHRYHIAERENYEGVRAYWHDGGGGKRESVVVGGEDNHNLKVLPETYPSKEEAQAAAESEFKRTQRSQATLDYTLAIGRPDIYPEMPVNVSGFKPVINETQWLVKRVTHEIADSGYTTSLELEVRDDPTTERHRSNFRKGRK